MSLITSMFPISFFMLIGGFITGSIAAFFVFGSVSVVMISVCIWLGIIRMLPIVRWIERWFRMFFPFEIEQFEKHLKESFVCEGTALSEPAIYLFHPHGLFAVAPAFHSVTQLTNWPVPVRGVVASWVLWIPVIGELIEAAGGIPAKYDVMKDVLLKGESLSVALGGINEILESTPGRMRLALSRRQGIFKMALETGTALVPVLTYGENELYTPVGWAWLDALNRCLVPLGVCFPVPSLTSCWNWMRLANRPLRSPVRTVIGSRLVVEAVEGAVDEAAVVALRERYFVELRKLYAETRPENYSEELEIL